MRNCMGLDVCILRIDGYLRGKDTRPRLVNVCNPADLLALTQHFRVGKNMFLSSTDFCAVDEMPNFDSLLEKVKAQNSPVFLTGLTTCAKLQGERVLKQLLSDFAHFSKLNCRTVVLCYQCEDALHFPDRRLHEIVYLVDGQETPKPHLVLLPPEMPIPSGAVVVDGIHNLAEAVEKGSEMQTIYVRTRKTKAAFLHSIFSASEESDAFQVLCRLDPVTQSLKSEYGTTQKWAYALGEVSKYKTWEASINSMFVNKDHLDLLINNWKTFTEQAQWMYFIALKLFGAGNSWCLKAAIQRCDSQIKLLHEVYRSLLTLDHTCAGYWEYYNERKKLIDALGCSDGEVLDYCSLVKCKGKYAIYYLTDKSRIEKALIIETLDQYAYEFTREEIVSVLEHVYPDLNAYLLDYRFNDALLDGYFQTYKYQKVINKIIPEFEAVVVEQAVRRDYNRLLPARTEKSESIPRQGTLLLFMDAMGVEFLGYIMEKCHQKRLMANVTVCRCELPSITAFNKEFLEGFSEKAIISIREIDEIKHKGKDNYDYQTTKLPIHLIRELEIVDETLERIRTVLAKGQYERAVMVSDHGATRLAVIKENTLEIDVNSKGTHGGRVCEYSDTVAQIPYATQAEDYYVLANYDRFKGGRAASVETHGGATLEEVTVPIIEITGCAVDIEVSILTPKIAVSFRKKAEILLFSKTKLEKVSVCVEEKHYDAESLDSNKFIIRMHDLKQAKQYTADVYSYGNLIAEGLSFIVEKEGSKEKELL